MKQTIEDQLIECYKQGYFPMASGDEVYLYKPDPRAVIPIYTYKTPKSLRSLLNKNYFEIKINENFNQVIKNCSKPRFEDDGIWISDKIIDWYTKLSSMGYAYSIETYLNGILVGGLYGVSINSAFFGESMFHEVPNASKFAFDFLMRRLKERKFLLLDTQYINDNVKRFGAIEIPNSEYEGMLKHAIETPNSFI